MIANSARLRTVLYCNQHDHNPHMEFMEARRAQRYEHEYSPIVVVVAKLTERPDVILTTFTHPERDYLPPLMLCNFIGMDNLIVNAGLWLLVGQHQQRQGSGRRGRERDLVASYCCAQIGREIEIQRMCGCCCWLEEATLLIN
jgi:hypothetical protein